MPAEQPSRRRRDQGACRTHPPAACYEVVRADAFEWLAQAEPRSLHAVVTDPPYGLIEYTPRELEKLQAGRGGV
jgi:hypothetical protein